MKQKTEIKVFIASPGDTNEERELIHTLIEEWNSMYREDEKNIELKVVRWEKDLAMRSNIRIQDAIIEDLLADSDILTGFFSTKFGSPTNKAESGTLEEIEYSLTNNKPVLMYFLEKHIPPSEFIKMEDQIKQINSFKEKYRNSNIYRDIESTKLDSFRKFFFMDINRTIKSLMASQKNKNDSGKVEIEKDIADKKWYKNSIKDLIESKLLEYDLILRYKREITFTENVDLWRSFADTRHSEIDRKIKRARVEAFNIKYGKYDYELDLRENYKESWYLPIISFLNNENYTLDKTFNVLGIASNNGLELTQIFKEYINANLSVLDLSNVAIESGKKLFRNIKFISENMEDCTINNSSIDVYINLRSIHSSGVDIRSTLLECHRILKPNGIAIISVSNGYLTQNEIGKDEFVETIGMYDTRVEAFSIDKPYDLINKIRVKMDDYGFRFTEIHTGKTEIFIKGKK